MQGRSRATRKRVLIFGSLSVLMILFLMTVQVAIAGPSAAPDAQSTVPSTLPTPTPEPTTPPVPPPAPPPLPPAELPTPLPDAATPTPVPGAVPSGKPLAPPKTESYNWTEPTSFEAPVFEEEEDPPPGGDPAPPAPKVAVTVPAKSMSVDGAPASGLFTLTPVEAPAPTEENLPDRPTLSFSGRSIEISVFGATGDISSDVRFNPPLEIGFDITDEEWEDAAGDITRFQVDYYSVTEGRWIQLSTTVDPFPPRRATGFTTHLTTFGLFVDSESTLPAPDGGDISLSTTVLALMGLFGLLLVGSGALYLRRAPRSATR